MRVNTFQHFFTILFGLSLTVAQPIELKADNTQSEAVSSEQAADLAKTQQAIIVDVREDGEWREQHIPNAIHIPLNELTSRLAELNRFKENTIITQCRSGKRSAKARELLKSAGFTKVFSLTGGLTAWTSAGFPTE